MVNECICGDPDCRIAYGLCHCGCQKRTSIAPRNDRRRGWINGEPIRYIKGHAHERRGDAHTLTDVDLLNRRANCSRCGLVSIKKDGTKKSGWDCTGAINPEHRLTEINQETKRGWCLGCLAEVDICLANKKRGRWVCLPNLRKQQLADRIKNPERTKETARKWREENPGRERDRRLTRQYGITQAEYEERFDLQDGLCYICSGPPDFHDRLVVDHCHTTGTVRHLLCNRCNRTLGMVQEDIELLESMIAYMLRWKS